MKLRCLYFFRVHELCDFGGSLLDNYVAPVDMSVRNICRFFTKGSFHYLENEWKERVERAGVLFRKLAWIEYRGTLVNNQLSRVI